MTKKLGSSMDVFVKNPDGSPRKIGSLFVPFDLKSESIFTPIEEIDDRNHEQRSNPDHSSS